MRRQRHGKKTRVARRDNRQGALTVWLVRRLCNRAKKGNAELLRLLKSAPSLCPLPIVRHALVAALRRPRPRPRPQTCVRAALFVARPSTALAPARTVPLAHPLSAGRYAGHVDAFSVVTGGDKPVGAHHELCPHDGGVELTHSRTVCPGNCSIIGRTIGMPV
jgi:hypothetical protein